MNKRQIQNKDRLGRIKQYIIDHAITPAIPRATVLVTEVNTLHEGMLEQGMGQEGGLNVFRSGSTQRRSLRNEIFDSVREISETAKGLDPSQHPGMRDLFRLNSAGDSYARLINTGASFVDHVATPAVKTLFTDRGFDADFDTALTAKLAALASATGIKFKGRQDRATGTVGLDTLTRRSTVVVRELSTIVVKHLRATDPLLVPVWKAAARLYALAVTAPAGEGESDSASAPGTPPAGS